ncbi:MAG: two-component system chemotaxis sensor kinase CheA [Oleispira sp.]|jgi:two-component system chemotaxis sensor kinase CheA
MSFEEDDEILQDFLVEAGEILELLSEQLVDLEQRPDDYDLLNAIFRGFHTVKGGAGFLQLNPLVDCCHEAESVFDILRNGKRTVTSDLMDVILESLDTVNEMFDAVRQGQKPSPATPELLATLNRLAQPESNDAPVPKAAAEKVEETVGVVVEAGADSEQSEDITDDEFEKLLDALDGEKAEAASAQSENSSTVDDPEVDDNDMFIDVIDEPAVAETSDYITEDEFEALLDQMHGSGKSVTPADSAGSDNKTVDTPSAPASSGSDDLITDSEFEDLLDRLHGKDQKLTTADAEPAKSQDVQLEASKAEVPKPQAAQPEVKKPWVKLAGKSLEAPASSAETTVRVDTKRLDDIMNMVGELVLVRNRLVRLGLKSNDEAMSKAVSNLDVVTGDLQSSVMKTRMQPIKKVFGRFPRVVRDLARSLKKEINLELRGEDTDLDKNLVEALADPLVHLVRNAVDHGIELPDQRESAGKCRVGVVTLAAEQEGDHILLSIEDDGGGMDANVLRNIAVKKGVMEQDAADRLTDNECYNLIFAPGFSTKEVISDVSGRGVGMDVVKTKITQLNGILNVDSTLGKGTRIEIKVPLTLAIMPTLMVMLKDQAFAFPLVCVNEIFHLDLSKTNVVDGQEVIVVRDKPIPLFHLKRWLVKGEAYAKADESSHVLVVSIGNQRAGFVVDQLIGQEEVVIKPLGAMLHGTAGMAGATITGDGRIALILDVPSMLQYYAGR